MFWYIFCLIKTNDVENQIEGRVKHINFDNNPKVEHSLGYFNEVFFWIAVNFFVLFNLFLCNFVDFNHKEVKDKNYCEFKQAAYQPDRTVACYSLYGRRSFFLAYGFIVWYPKLSFIVSNKCKTEDKGQNNDWFERVIDKLFSIWKRFACFLKHEIDSKVNANVSAQYFNDSQLLKYDFVGNRYGVVNYC
jgi:hypothetical protein